MDRLETFLERHRAQLPHWLVVAFGFGIALWFGGGSATAWTSSILLALGLALAGRTMGRRTGQAFFLAGLAIAFGTGSMWWRAERVAAPVIDRPTIASFEAAVKRVELRSARDDARLTLVPADTGLPPVVRVTVPIGVGERLHEGGEGGDPRPASTAAANAVSRHARLCP